MKFENSLSKYRLISVGLLCIGFALFTASLFEPVWTCENSDASLSGFSVLISGFLGLLFFDPRWFCNACVLMAFWGVLFRRPIKKRWLCIFFALVGSTTLFGPYLCGGSGGALGAGVGFAVGGYLWIVSLWFFALAVEPVWAKKELESQQQAAIKHALSTLVRQQNVVNALKRDFNKLKDDFSFGLGDYLLKIQKYERLRLDFASLEFLLLTEYIDTFFRLTVEQERFDLVIDCMKIRREFYVNQIQKKLPRAFFEKKNIAPEVVVSTLGQDIYEESIKEMEKTHAYIEASFVHISKSIDELSLVSKKLASI